MQLPIDSISELLSTAQHIVVLQADNPDGDSLGSALALEHILGDMGKQVSLYCGVDIPGYLHYLQGWDRVTNEVPSQFDASIIVDASTVTLFEKLGQSGQQGWLASKPCLVLDHHGSVEQLIPYANLIINEPAVSSTGELLYCLATEAGWPLAVEAQELLLTSILGDTQGLSNQLASPQTYRVVAAMIEAGVDRPALEEKRREFSKMPRDIYRYKAGLLRNTAWTEDGRIAHVTVGHQEIMTYSPLYNPAPLIQGDMLQTAGVDVAIVFKRYNDGKVTGAIRCNPSAGIGGELAIHMGGGGHAFASGFKDVSGRTFAEIRDDCLTHAQILLSKLANAESGHEAV